MLNFRIENLASALAELNAAGIDSGDIVSMDGVGQFARIHDPEGNPIELWEPAERLCCTNRIEDSLFESRVVAGVHEQLVPYEVQDDELGVL